MKKIVDVRELGVGKAYLFVKRNHTYKVKWLLIINEVDFSSQTINHVAYYYGDEVKNGFKIGERNSDEYLSFEEFFLNLKPDKIGFGWDYYELTDEEFEPYRREIVAFEL